MHPLEQGHDPDNAEQADAQPHKYDRTYGVSGTAEDRGENFDDRPDEVEWHKISHDFKGRQDYGFVGCQNAERRTLLKRKGFEPEPEGSAEGDPGA